MRGMNALWSFTPYMMFKLMELAFLGGGGDRFAKVTEYKVEQVLQWHASDWGCNSVAGIIQELFSSNWHWETKHFFGVGCI
jgi:hypothetical protein